MLNDEALLAIEQMLRHPKAVALGEIGLDYHYDLSPRETQRLAFARQLELAVALNKPVIVHSREAAADTLELMRRFRPAEWCIVFRALPNWQEFMRTWGFMSVSPGSHL
jgi:Tat protein secretion system quality control protein TatD with DNase activity